ncbi:MAG: hypothetical protein CM15mP62_12120 [Rhodospirillaceae bacterium]|nr:MAG: hypothetical protein CM15mP62_12120 [Rhodospirillaceae bacterium]
MGSRCLCWSDDLVSGWLISNRKNLIIYASTALHFLVLFILAIYFLDLPGIEPPLKSDPLRKLRAWDQTSEHVAKFMNKYPGHILLTDDRKTMASLIYGLRAEKYRPLIWDYDGIQITIMSLLQNITASHRTKFYSFPKWDNPYPI